MPFKQKVKKPETVGIENDETYKLMGIAHNDAKYQTINKNEWKNCIYCEKYHHNDYYIPGINYCIHCWAWLNSYEYDIENGKYNGLSSIEDINKMIKKVYPVHIETNCKNSDCLFDKIKKHADAKTLHLSLIELLELNKKPKQEVNCFNYKNKNLNINFEESFIII
jgi:hypothetical protein